MAKRLATRLILTPKGKSVKSTDPRKREIVAALQAASGCGKITSVVETKSGFAGHCLLKSPTTRCFEDHGWWEVEK